MSTKIKYRLLLSFSILCLIGLAVQGAYLWQLNEQLAGNTTQGTLEDKLAEKILANASDPASTALDPFNSPFPALPDPFSAMQQMQQQFDSLFGTSGFGSFFSPPAGSAASGFASSRFTVAVPDIEVAETPTEYRITIPVTPDEDIQLNTSIEDNALSITGTIKSSANTQNSSFATSMLSQSQFSRTIDLPEPVDEFGLSTQQTNDGIIISVPKKMA